MRFKTRWQYKHDSAGHAPHAPHESDSDPIENGQRALVAFLQAFNAWDGADGPARRIRITDDLGDVYSIVVKYDGDEKGSDNPAPFALDDAQLVRVAVLSYKHEPDDTYLSANGQGNLYRVIVKARPDLEQRIADDKRRLSGTVFDRFGTL